MLLDRIDRGALRKRSESDAEVIESVLDHLRRMLNTRQGHVLVAHDYGMPDFTGFSQAPDARDAIRQAIRDSIKNYEPRLKKVQVNYIETDQLEIRFEIVATLQAESKGLPVTFETRIDPSGRVRIR